MLKSAKNAAIKARFGGLVLKSDQVINGTITIFSEVIRAAFEGDVLLSP
jgi:hypothetical protein